MGKRVLSFSQVNMLARCGEQYRQRYIEGIKTPPGVQLVIGKGTHGAVESDLRHKMEWGELLPDEQIADTAAESTRKAWDADAPVLNDGDPDRGGAIDMAVSLAHAHHRQLAPKIQPTALERGFVLEMDGYPFDVTGYIDIEEAGRIRDTKTAAKTPAADEADKSDQLTVYHLEAATRGLDPEVALDYLVKTKEAKALTLTSRRTPEDHGRLLARFEAASRLIDAGTFIPTGPGNWWCSSKWCGYWDRCAWGARGRSAPLVDVSRLTSRLVERRP